MPERDERFDGFELDLETNRIAERPIGIRERTEQVAVLVGRRGEHVAGAGQDVHLQHRLVRQAVAKRRGLDAEPGDGPAERDRLQLRHHQRRQPVGERGSDEVLVRAHPGHIGGPGVGVDRDDARQPRCVQALDSVLGTRPEQVRRGFGQPNRGVFRDGPIAREKPLHARGVSSPYVGRSNRHRYTLVRGPDALAGYDKRRRPLARRMQKTAGMLQRLCGIEQSHHPARKGRPAGGIGPVPSAQRGGHPSGPGRRRPNCQIGIPGRRRPLSRPSQEKVIRVDIGRSGGRPREPRAVSPW